jgi:hypothetical protein|tara:strand:+ start:1041 stop:1505 length:465 start_codon:yes stop_codon:yes gene_type:complete
MNYTKQNQRKSFKRQLKTKLTETADVGNFYPTNRVAAYWFSRLNALLFGNRLGRVYIEVKKLHHDWGRCIANWDNRKTPKGKFNQRLIPHHIPVKYYIELHCKFDSWKDFIETLAHEMVHLYQMTIIKDPYSNHNKYFYSFTEKFKAIGLSLRR